MFHPRPQLRRDSFFSLDGEWEISVNGGDFQRITVPYPPEAPASGVSFKAQAQTRLTYRRDFSLPESFWQKGRVLLHFGAVDQTADVMLNGHRLGFHRGGYEAFSFDVTPYLGEDNLLTVEVTDYPDEAVFPYGKQRIKRGGMWYTPISGIWQTVWMEWVPDSYIRALRVHTAGNEVTLSLDVLGGGGEGILTVFAPEGQLSIPVREGKAFFRVESPRFWSPEDPYLYECLLTVGEDRVATYFAIRTLEIRRVGGIPRLCLNGRPYFFHALLDQGYFFDGIFTPQSPHQYEEDIRTAKALGFNSLRKHIKVEPEWFYYACDRLGMVVLQDMVNNGRYSFLRDTALPTLGFKRRSDKRMHRNEAARKAFFEGMEATVRRLWNHPCVCYWTIFNEGWGQFDGEAAYRRLRELDDTRFIDTVSGWFKGPPSDVDSEHVYFKSVKLKYGDRPMVLSEFGGYAHKVAGHVYDPDTAYGYRHFSRREDFEDALVRLYEEEIIPAVRQGLCAAVYTQLTDVEDETNGLITYDRQVVKVDAQRMREIGRRLASEMESAEAADSQPDQTRV